MRIITLFFATSHHWTFLARVVLHRWWVGHLVFIVCLTTIGCGDRAVTKATVKEAELESIDVETMVVDLQSWPTVVRTQGNLDADERSVVGSNVTGRVAKIHVEVGDFVRLGDPLITLDREDARLLVQQAEAQLRQSRSAVGLSDEMSTETLDPISSPPVREAEANWDEAKNALERSAKLLRQNAIAQSEYDQADALERVASARYASAINGVREKIAMIGVRQAELSMAQQRLEDTIISSPFDGFVQDRSVAPGTYVSAGQTVASVVRTDPLRFRGTLPERYAQSLRVNQGIELKIESLVQPRNARITRISPTLNPQSRTLAFEVEIENRDRILRSGLFAEAEVVIDETAQKLVVPESAIVEFAGTRKVWEVESGIAREQAVVIGEQRDGRCEIIQGLAVGAIILVNGDQGRVAIVRSSSLPMISATDQQVPGETGSGLSATSGDKPSEPVTAGSS